MSNPLAGIEVDYWYKGWIVASLVILIACVAAKNDNAGIVAVGALIFGFGEWINHPRRERIESFWGDHMKVVDQSRAQKPVGLLIDLAGASIAGYGIWKMATA